MANLTASDGHTLDCWMTEAQGTRRGGIVILQEIFGVTDQLKGVADRYAALGYDIAIPALFDRQERDAVIPFDQGPRGRDLMLTANLYQMMIDIDAAIQALRARGGKVVPYKPLLDEAITLSQHKPSAVLMVDRGLSAFTSVPGRDHGYADLRQQQLWRYEANFEYRLPQDAGVINANFFFEDLEDVIDNVDVSTATEVLSARGNVGDGERYGVRLDGSLRLSFVNQPQILVTAGLNLEESTLVDPFLNIDREPTSVSNAAGRQKAMRAI